MQDEKNELAITDASEDSGVKPERKGFLDRLLRGGRKKPQLIANARPVLEDIALHSFQDSSVEASNGNEPSSIVNIFSRRVPDATQYLREVAAYRVSEFLGFRFVPTTTIREIDHQVGSIQRFVPDAEIGENYDRPIPQEELMRLYVFDVIIHNRDRHGGNFLVLRNADDTESIVAIDHGLSFSGGADSYYEYSGQPLPESLIEQLKIVRANTEGKVRLLKELADLLDEKSLAAFEEKLENVLQYVDQHGCMPPED